MARGQKGVIIRVGSGFRETTTEVRLDSKAREREQGRKQKRRRLYGEMSFQEREELIGMDGSAGDWEDEDEDPAHLGFNQLPPGEEGMLQSHAGGEEELCRTLFELPTSKRQDLRDRRDRRQLQNQQWKAQIPALIECYLAWQNGDEPPPLATLEPQVWEVLVIDTYERRMQSFSSGPHDEPNVILMQHGYIGTAPRPTVAVSTRLLNLFHELHVACPRLSLQAHVKALCRLHRVNYKPYLAVQFSQAYDVFLAIRHGVDAQVAVALGRDSENWRMKNVCAPCLYALEDENPLHPAMLVAIDGNQSLKLVDDLFRYGESLPDDRDGRSDIWLNEQDVDRFKDEVQSARKAALRSRSGAERNQTAEPPAAPPIPPPLQHPRDEAGEQPPEPGDDDLPWADLDEEGDVKIAMDECVKRWKAAGPEARKKMFALFAATGVFICVCRHGHILVICDMIRSGELMKYPLAIIHKLMEVYGNDFRYGYDIACAFHKILMRSSLGPRATALGVSGVVPAFHGHAHNRRCQLSWHPLYMPGCGKEDFEGCERVFSQSNALAATTRFASTFHRHQAIDGYFKHWDYEKHSEEATFLVNNYKQALEIIQRDSAQLAALRAKQPMSDEDFEKYFQQETQYIDALTTESDEVIKVAEYMDALRKAEALSEESRRAAHEFNNLDYYITTKGYETKQISAIKRRYTTSYARYMEATENARRIEQTQDIAKTWEKDSAEYKKGLTLLVERQYRQTVDRLERLLVQRLLELTKLGMNGTGYKQREKITKALKTRGTAIQRALKEYNERAMALPTPRPALTWTDVVEMTTIAEFDLLRDARQDIRALEWAQPLRREAMGLYFNIKRAREEIVRLDVEINRLLTFMLDEHADYYHAIRVRLFTNPELAHELALQWRGRDAVHTDMAMQLHSLRRLAGYKGSLQFGTRVGRDAGLSRCAPLPLWAVSATTSPTVERTPDEPAEDVAVQLADNEEGSEANQLLDFSCTIPQ